MSCTSEGRRPASGHAPMNLGRLAALAAVATLLGSGCAGPRTWQTRADNADAQVRGATGLPGAEELVTAGELTLPSSAVVRGVEMDMGLHRVLLQPDGSDRARGRLLLPVCTLAAMEWELVVALDKEAVAFRFAVSGRHSPPIDQ